MPKPRHRPNAAGHDNHQCDKKPNKRPDKKQQERMEQQEKARQEQAMMEWEHALVYGQSLSDADYEFTL